MLVCNVSLKPPRSAIAAALAEAASAVDATATGNIVFATLVDDPASVRDTVNAYLGEIMREAASAADVISAGSVFAGVIAEATSPADMQDSTTTAAFIATALDSATASANVTLSNVNLTATHTNTTQQSGARSIAYKTTGKYYFEGTMTSTSGAGDCVGLVTSAGTYANMHNGQNCLVFIKSTGNIFANNVNASKSIGAVASGDLIGVAVDLAARKAWYRKNGGNWNGLAIGSENPATATGGATLAPTVSFAPAVLFTGTGSAAGNASTMNFGSSAFTGVVPSGFTAGWPL